MSRIIDLWTFVATILGALAALSLLPWPDTYVQQGISAPGSSFELAVPVSPMAWSAEIESTGAALLVVTCDGVETTIPAPGRHVVKDDAWKTCSARVLATGPGVARWTVTTRLEAKK